MKYGKQCPKHHPTKKRIYFISNRYFRNSDVKPITKIWDINPNPWKFHRKNNFQWTPKNHQSVESHYNSIQLDETIHRKMPLKAIKSLGRGPGHPSFDLFMTFGFPKGASGELDDLVPLSIDWRPCPKPEMGRTLWGSCRSWCPP